MCGIVGITGATEVAVELYEAMLMLQHRGQDAAGMVTYGDKLHMIKDNGLVSEVFNPERIEILKGTMGLGQVRYRTTGDMDPAAAQPFLINAPYGVALIHNGNLTNYHELKELVTGEYKRYINSTSDTELAINVLGHELELDFKGKIDPASVFEVVRKVMNKLKGSYSIITVIAGQGMLAFRDPYGIRPLVFGHRKSDSGDKDEYILASETVALLPGGFEILDDIKPGEAIYIDNDLRVHRQICHEKPVYRPCIFEHIYLARPDSVLDQISVYKSRLRMGRHLAKKVQELNLEIDVVIPVPDTGRTAALTLAEELGVKYREGLMKNRYVGRTFIMPGQTERKASITRKLTPVALEIRKKNVLLVDDSIVRGNTSRKIIELVRECGANKVYLASCAPPLKHPCVYGVYMPSRKEFVANNLEIPEIAREIGADAVIYQDLSALVESVKTVKSPVTDFCTACLDGKYPTPEVNEKYLSELEAEVGA